MQTNNQSANSLRPNKLNKLQKAKPAASIESQPVNSIHLLVREAVSDLENIQGISPEVLQARQSEFQTLHKDGEILPSNHHIHQKVLKIFSKLDSPAGSDLIVLDSENFTAYYNKSSKQIVISRGVLTFLSKNLKNFSEDHLAALLAHEIEHAFADEKSQKNQADYSLSEKVMVSHDPAEEMRADSEGMRRAAAAGYNPQAIIELLKAFGLTTNRNATSHPEIIDRIRYLDLRIASDEHPLSNTTKAKTTFQQDFLDWCRKPSNVYQKTEELLSSSWTELDLKLDQATSLEEFLQVYSYYHNAASHSEAKAFQKQPILQEITLIMMSINRLKALSGNNDIAGFYYSQFTDALETNRYQKDLENSEAYINNLPADKTNSAHTQAHLAFLEKEKADSLKALTVHLEAIQKHFLTDLENSDDKKNQELLDLYQKIKACVESNNFLDQELFDQLFRAEMSELNSAEIRLKRLKRNQEAKTRGQRLPYEKESDLKAGIDFDDQNQFEHLKELYQYNLSVRSLPEKESNQNAVKKLEKLFIKNSFSENEAEFFSKTFFTPTKQEEIHQFLSTINKSRLAFLIDFFSKNKQINSIRLSPTRSSHQAQKSSTKLLYKNFSPSFSYMHHFSNGSRDSLGGEITALTYILGWEYYQRAYPENYFQDLTTAHPYLPVEDLNISETEWEILGKLDIFSDEVNKLAIQKIIQAKGDQSKLTPFLLNKLKNLTWIPYSPEDQRSDDLAKLLDYQLWDDFSTQKIFKPFLDRSFREIIADLKKQSNSIPQKESITKTAESLIELTKKVRLLSIKTNYQHIPKDKYDSSPVFSETELSGHLQNLIFANNNNQVNFDTLKDELDQNQIIGFTLWEKAIRQSLANLPLDELLDLQSKTGLNRDENKSFRIVLNLLIQIKQSPHLKNSTQIAKNCCRDFSSQLVIDTIRHAIIDEANHRGNQVKNYYQTVRAFISENPLRQRYLLSMPGLVNISENSAQESQIRSEFEALIEDELDYNVDSQGRENSNYNWPSIFAETNDFLYNLDYQDFLQKNRQIVENYFHKSLEDLTIDEKREILVKLVMSGLDEDTRASYGTGLQLETFQDLLWRRFNFVESVGSFISSKSKWIREIRPNEPAQKYLAHKLREAEEKILKQSNLNDKIIELSKVAPVKSMVRDIYLEKFMRDEIAAKNNPQLLANCLKIWEMMSEVCPSRNFLGSLILKTTFDLQPDLLQKFTQALDLIKKYLPESSFSRNHLLEKLENSTSLTIKDLGEIINLRFSEEGKSKITDNGISALIVNKINEMNRAERQDFYFWITGLSKHKPGSIFELEMKCAGYADSAVGFFAAMNEKEKMLLIDRLALGKEGIFDLEGVSSMEKTEASHSRLTFVDQLLDKVFIDQNPSTKLLKKIMKVILLEADSHKASKILGKMTNTLIEAQLQNKKLSMPEIASLMLNELGVVGKKVSQSLAELEALPADFRQEFKKAQSSAQLVPKRALADLADSYGLLEGKDGIKILSFGKMLGAASNKQACLLEVEITSNDFALPPGKHQLVGKFKRPSAQKTSNLEADLNLLEKALTAITSESTFTNSLPSGFLDTIRDGVMRELDFQKEKSFSKLLHKDLKKLNQAGQEYQLGLPTIIYANADLVIETLAPGISLRDYLDQKAAQELPPEYKSIDQQKVMEKVLSEAIRELLVSGNLHADLHPGNIFVSNKKQVTLIDVGMNEVLSEDQRESIAILLSGLTSGSDKLVNKALQKLGLNLPKILNLKFNDFSNNTSKMIDASKASNQKIPPLVTSLFSAISKLSTYSKGLDSKAMVRILKEVGEMLVKQKVGLDFEFEVDLK